MKIAYITTYDFSAPGGVRNHIIELAHQMMHRGHEVTILAPASGDFTPMARIRFIRLAVFPSAGKTGFIPPHLLVGLSVIFRLNRLLNEEHFDLIHLHEPLLPPLCLSVLFHKKTPIIATFHTYYEKGQPMYRLCRPFFNRLLKNLRGRITVSEASRSYIHQYFPYDYNIIPNGVNLAKFSTPRPRLPQLTPGFFNLLFIGHAQFRRKGLRYMLEAYHLLKEDYPQLRLIIAGTHWAGRSKPKILDERSERDVLYLGTVSEEDLISLYQSADIFCAPSTGNESFGMVLIEAMAAGAAIVASSIKGYADVVKHGVEGHLVEPKDSLALAHGIKTLIDDPYYRERLVTHAREGVVRYGWERLGRLTLNYYKDILGAIYLKTP